MITKIILNEVASYKRQAELVTDKKVNLLYGLNGTGKSTFSDYLYDRSSPRFSKCTVEGLENEDTVLVYNQKFIQDTFYEPQGIHGIFTLSKGNAEAKKIIDCAIEEVRKLVEQKKKIEEKRAEEEKKHRNIVDEYKNQVWKIKTDFTGGDRVLEFCLEKLKGTKDALFSHIISLNKPTDTLDYSIEDLKKEAQQIQGEPQIKRTFATVKINVAKIEESELLTKVIIGNKNTSVSALIEQLKNSDWVHAGIKYVHMNGEKALCPFCQQETVTQSFIEQINSFFDESYNRDKELLNRLIEEYDTEIKKTIDYLKTIRDEEDFLDRKKEIESIVSSIQSISEKNLNLLREKANNPSMTVSLQKVLDIEVAANAIIDAKNKEVEEFNKKVADIKGSQLIIKDKFWRLMRHNYNSVIELYEAEEKKYQQTTRSVQEDLEKKKTEINEKNELIAENRKKTINIDEAVENIKNGLIDIGITDFSIEKYSEEDALYRLKRDNLGEDVFKSLSEGEKMIISFLYFIELCKGEPNARKTSNRKIVVIDDPISSLSHIYVFNVGRLIHNEFLRTDKYNQVFVLTHSLYFFYELTNINHKEREATQQLFRICKNNDGSYFENMRYEDIQNDYQAYWHIVKDEKQAPALIANCMRNIIEYFFNFVEKQDYAQVFQSKELQETSYMAFNRYMNRESHSKGQNIFDLKEFDYNAFREAFKKVFEIEGYIEHYNKMINI